MILPRGFKDKKKGGGMEIAGYLKTIAVQMCLIIMIKTDNNK
jgi:hypothetical protein